MENIIISEILKSSGPLTAIVLMLGLVMIRTFLNQNKEETKKLTEALNQNVQAVLKLEAILNHYVDRIEQQEKDINGAFKRIRNLEYITKNSHK